METSLKHYIGKEVKVEITGNTIFLGILIDIGLDILVIYDGKQYLYIPMLHVHSVKRYTDEEIKSADSEETIFNESETISYRKMLQHAKGRFVEIYVTGNKSIHGYITSVLNDYFVFYSPVYKTMCISLHHLKWLTPYNHELTPYMLNNEELPVKPSSIPLSRTFEEQLKKVEGNLVVFDLGDNPQKIGVVKSIANNIVQLITADGEMMFCKLMHIKTMHLP
ncbi:DUF2642 domain-containing protein [Metabacillus iocasae]|uniref:DUF2642 domain-containing protein n=1 Tax=Priestia iocasae TaxID=2291674 RepID=A0ABS2QUY7_9BACI|nr:DUF2642 domain-containing protein [Metabacillus iocasae]MBM7703305.1 hypothetical protein [Metabacillus iocasae]